MVSKSLLLSLLKLVVFCFISIFLNMNIVLFIMHFMVLFFKLLFF